MTETGDVVLVYMDNSPAFFARVEQITPDVKPQWFHVKLLVLQVPLLVVTWILREVYFNGGEFTMGGHPMRIEKVVAPAEEELAEEVENIDLPVKEPRKSGPAKPKKGGNVVSIFERRKKEQEPS